MVNANAITTVSHLVMKQAMTLEERLACILEVDGGKNSLGKEVKVFDVHSYNSMSGYNYWIGDDLIGQLYLGTLLSGTYVVYKRTYIEGVITEVYDYYDTKGNFFYTSSTLDGQCVHYNNISMDPLSPFINHIYNILYNEYQGTTFNYGNTGRIKFLETLLNRFLQKENITLSVEKGLKDQAILDIRNEHLDVEEDRVLTWHERQTIFKQLRENRSKILGTKRRAHGFQWLLYDLLVRTSDIKLKYETFKKRPVNNFLGTLYNNTIGKFLWFCNTVKSNMGYSVAMAIYGPFTFYFITQPMNPHAMWAVGKVRNAYIQTVRSFEDPIEEDPIIAEAQAEQGTDSVSTKQAAPPRISETKIRKVDWGRRMDNFKAMQIAYESSMVPAERFGRTEQFEWIFNFPLTAEAAWMEMELYYNDVVGKIKFYKNLDQRMVKFLNHEKERTLELQFYIWQKLGQFFMDHPYIVVDEEKEQPQRSYYTGRQFIFFKTMTEKLTQMGVANSPVTHKNVEMLAKKFEDMKVEGNSVLDTLKKNSKVFQQKNYLSSDEHRDYMKRQWEVVFLQQNKKQEASSFALQTYSWSVKNAMWLLQTIYSAKRSEISSLVWNYDLSNTAGQKNEVDPTMNEYLGNMFNNLVLEYVSIRKEMLDNLPGDNEANLRENVINNIKSYLIERDKLWRSNIYASR